MNVTDINLLINKDWIASPEPSKCCQTCGHPKQYHTLGRGKCWNQAKGRRCSAHCHKFKGVK